MIWRLSFIVFAMSYVTPSYAQPLPNRSIWGWTAGETVEVTVDNAGGAKLWTSFLVEPLLPVPEKPTVFEVPVPADALGVHVCRTVSDAGASPMAAVLVDDLKTVTTVSGDRSNAPVVTLPIAVEGNLRPQGRHYCRIEVSAGQTVSFDVWAQRLGSPVDAILFVTRPDGVVICYSDDTPGVGSDPQLQHTFAEGGTYIVEIRDVQYQGGNHHYRLRMGEFPLALGTFPATVQIGTDTPLQAVNAPVTGIAIDAKTVGWQRVAIRPETAQASLFGTVQVSEQKVIIEAEPNDVATDATVGEVAAVFTGVLQQPGDRDCFRINGKQGERFRFVGETRVLGFPTDLMLQVEDAQGKALGQVDDAGTNEGILDVTLPTDGEYVLVVSELLRRGGPEFAYQIQTQRRSPSFELRLEADALNVPRGGVLAVPLAVERLDYAGEIAVAVEGLPAGVTAARTVFGPNQNTAVLTLSAAAEVPPQQLWGIKITGRSQLDADRHLLVAANVTAGMRKRWSNLFAIPRLFEQQIALSTAPAPPFRLSIDPPVLTLTPNGKGTFKVRLERGAETTEAISLATDPAKDAVVAGVGVAVKPIPKEASEVELELTVNDKVPIGTYTVVLLGTHQKEKQTTTAHAVGLTFSVQKGD